MTTIKLEEHEWQAIKADLEKRYPKSVMLVRTKMKSELGFTVREHRGWIKDPNYDPQYAFGSEYDSKIYKVSIHLDFYSEGAATMFRLKYL